MYISHKKLREIINTWIEAPMSLKTRVSHISTDLWEYFQSEYKKEHDSLELYTVIAHRWGDEESHTYLVGSFKNLESAIAEALEHRDARGGKYDCNIYKDSFDGYPTKVFDYGNYENRLLNIRSRDKDE